MLQNVKRILVPVDGAGVSERVFRGACKLARALRAELFAVYVIVVPMELALDSPLPEERQRGEAALSRIEAIGAEEKIKARASLLQARQPGPAIVQEAEDRSMDLLIMALPLQRRLGPRLLGDTSAYVLQNAPCQTLLWRDEISQLAGAQG